MRENVWFTFLRISIFIYKVWDVIIWYMKVIPLLNDILGATFKLTESPLQILMKLYHLQ